MSRPDSPHPETTTPPNTADDAPPAVRRYHITHETRFHYSAPVRLDQTVLRLQPRTSVLQNLRSFSIRCDPAPTRHTHGNDLHGNARHWIWFEHEHTGLHITTTSSVDCLMHDPFDYLVVDEGVVTLPARYAEPVYSATAHYRKRAGQNPSVDALARQLARDAGHQTVAFLSALAAHLKAHIRPAPRLAGDPTTPTQTLERGEGACRDTAVLFMDACRAVGLAARFVSGYAWEAIEQDQRELHAWAEVYLPGAGWRGYDPTTGLACANRHVAVAASPTPSYAAPTTGTFTRTQSGPGNAPPITSRLDFDIHMTVEERPATPPPADTTFAWP